MKVKTLLVKAFTKDPTQGNPAGITIDADNLTREQMFYISNDLGFSESAFVSKSNNADFRLKFFSPHEEVDLCGHNTIATFYTLATLGRISIPHESVTVTQETNAGILSVICHKDGKTVMTQSEPKFWDAEQDKEKIAHLLSITVSDLTQWPIQTVSTGMPKTMVPVNNLATLMKIDPKVDAIKEYCLQTGSKGLYPFTEEALEQEDDFHARQFNPFTGVKEDPVTGIAGGALGAYLKMHNLFNKSSFIIEQGNILKKDGKMYVDTTDGIKVGGYGAIFGEKEFNF